MRRGENTTDLAHPVWNTDYENVTITRRDRCICNPRALKDAGYTPQALYQFYQEVNTKLQENFGYKQKTYMNISQGFPRINNNGRFIGDHLDRYVFDTSQPYDPNSTDLHPRVLKTAEYSSKVDVSHLPEETEQTDRIIGDGRDPAFFGGKAAATFGWGVENAALNQLPLDLDGGKCRQQRDIASKKKSLWFGSAIFPIPTTQAIGNAERGCPNQIAAEEGTINRKVTGFQTQNNITSAHQVDSALWNLTLNSNGVFIELYEQAVWKLNIQTNNGARVLQKPPSIKENIPSNADDRTPHASSAKAKTLEEWNKLLLLRARELPKDKNNRFVKNPHPISYMIKANKGSATRFYFNSGARRAFVKRGKAVKINKIQFN